jgi:hypothetical protein
VKRSARQKVRSGLSWWSEPRLNRSVARGLKGLRNLLLGRGKLKARLSLTLRSTRLQCWSKDRRWWRNPNSDEVLQELKILLLGGCLLPLHLKLLPLKL